MNVQLLAHTPEPEKVIAAAAKLCYAKSDIQGLFDKLTPENTEKSTHAPLYTQNEMLVLAVAVLLLLEGADDILILALGYTLCP